MKKTIYIILVILIIILGVRFFLGGDEDTWICEDGQWVAHGNPASEMPTEGCLEPESNDNGIFGALEKAKDLNKNSYTFDVSGQGLSSLTAEFFNDNTGVQYLNVSNNNLTGALPAEIRKLTNLKELNASHNNLTGIPAEIGQLNSLEKIDFSYNNIDGIPNEIINLADTLQELNVVGNKYSAEQLEALQVMLPSTNIIF